VRKTPSLAVLLPFASAALAADEAPALKTEADRINYSVGFQVGGDFKRQGVEVSPEAILKGVQDGASGARPLMTTEEMQRVLVDLKKKVVAAAREQKLKDLEWVKAQGQTFLAENAKKQGVVTRPSGLQYRVLAEGTGKSPGLTDTVSVNYRGTTMDGAEFDSSYRTGAPAAFRVDGVIAGWQEALPLMKEGAKWQIVIPPDLAYGDRGPLAQQVLVFEVDLLQVGVGEGETAPAAAK
jgi:FKBP-type peptidyl-prolyl cis-trans isomerase FklB